MEDSKQCKDCTFRDDGTVWGNDYIKQCCLIYQHPDIRADISRSRIINNKMICEYCNDGTDNEDTE
ncbi:MAG: hypothetical protein ACI4S9_08800 [Christensenellales bacterium]